MRKFTMLGAILILVLGAARICSADPTPSVTGKVQQYLLTPHGEVEGLLLADGASVRFPPHEGEALAEMAKPGAEIAAVLFPWTGDIIWSRSQGGHNNQYRNGAILDRPTTCQPSLAARYARSHAQTSYRQRYRCPLSRKRRRRCRRTNLKRWRRGQVWSAQWGDGGNDARRTNRQNRRSLWLRFSERLRDGCGCNVP